MIFIEGERRLRFTQPMIDPTLPPNADLTAPTHEERTWALVAHLSAFSGHFIPFGHVVGPLIVWVAKRDSSAFVAHHAKESLNAQLTATLYFAITGVLCLLLIGIPMLIGVWIADVLFVIIAAITAYDGKSYRYPLILRLIH